MRPRLRFWINKVGGLPKFLESLLAFLDIRRPGVRYALYLYCGMMPFLGLGFILGMVIVWLALLAGDDAGTMLGVGVGFGALAAMTPVWIMSRRARKVARRVLAEAEDLTAFQR